MGTVYCMSGFLKPGIAKTIFRYSVSIILTFLIMGLSVVDAQSVPVTITINPAKDNTIYQRNTANSNGAGEFFIAGTTGSPYFNHALINFDIAGNIPAGAIIQSASLTLHLAGTSGNSGSYNIELHKLLQDWGEGSSNAGTQAGQGAPAATSDATWTNNFFPSSLWTSGGGNYSALTSGAQLVNSIGFYTWTSAGIVADIQDWLNNPFTNYGWLLKSNELASFQAKKFESKENPVIANRPVLSITYIEFVPNSPPVISIMSPVNNAVYPSGSTVTLSATASDTDGTISKVSFYNNGIKFLEDATAPYGYVSNELDPGNYVVTAKAYDNSGDSTVSDTVRVTVAGCTGSGSILAEGYTGISGNTLTSLGSDADYPNNPDVVTTLNKFEYGPNFADNYGGRVRGYICAPSTGNYTFYISSDEQSELWLSTDESPSNIRRIAYVETKTGFRSWYSSATQRSVAIRLVKGVRYYIESVHKEGTGSDHLSVGWVIPGGAFEAPIGGNRLSPWQVSTPAMAAARTTNTFEVAMRSPEQVKKLTIKATPNPSSSYFTINIQSSSSEAVQVTLTDVLGRVVEIRAGVAANGTIQIGNKLNAAGMYFVEVQQGQEKQRLKLVRQ